MRSLLALLAALLALTSAAPAPAAPESSEPARQHFRRGVELYEERDFNGAATEFRRAYQLAPHFRVLYNLGQVAQEQHDWAAGLDYFSRYLKDGAGQLPEERRAQAEEEVAKLRQRVGRLVVVTQATNAEILVDGVPAARTPVAGPINVNIGRRRVELQDGSGKSAPSWVEVAGDETAIVELKMLVKAADTPSTAEAHRSRPVHRSHSASRAAWWTWLATAFCAAGAAATGTLAYRWSRDLHDRRNTFPATQQELLDDQRKVQRMGWLTDGLLAGTAVFAGISLFLSLQGQERHDGVSLGPSGLGWKGTF